MADFADRVRIKSSEETRRRGLAGLEGVVYGWTTLSVTGLEVIGDRDQTVNVHFDELGEGFWFAEELIETIDHGAGTLVTLDGVDKEWMRRPNGEWQERPRSDEESA